MTDAIDQTVETAVQPAPEEAPAAAPANNVELLRWHLDRYDRLRSSTANRASVILSAAAILSAANAVVLSQLLSGPILDRRWLFAAFGAALVASSTLVVLSLIRAAGVLVTGRDSRELFGGREELPPGLVFNGTDTVRRLHSFAEFAAVVDRQQEIDIYRAAQVELWIGIQQHRYRYVRLRSAGRLLRWAAVAVLLVLSFAVVTRVALM
ncbi:hypothetical protein AB0M46_35405 [Dactylosporangium sp. NPDC051485]|uniref:hypothetical protein n=1 Tax=Dactylosporangium sp. NPDC051485 TaxID=3154846 RepID=UPI003424048D